MRQKQNDAEAHNAKHNIIFALAKASLTEKREDVSGFKPIRSLSLLVEGGSRLPCQVRTDKTGRRGRRPLQVFIVFP